VSAKYGFQGDVSVDRHFKGIAGWLLISRCTTAFAHQTKKAAVAAFF
jgi:hypothetical protein